jgi:hypothetical protein
VDEFLMVLKPFSPLCQRLLEGVLLAVLEDRVSLRSDEPLQLVLPSPRTYAKTTNIVNQLIRLAEAQSITIFKKMRFVVLKRKDMP